MTLVKYNQRLRMRGGLVILKQSSEYTMKTALPTCLSSLRLMGTSVISSRCRNEVGESRGNSGGEGRIETTGNLNLHDDGI